MQERWNDNMKVVIVGGVAGGATAAARIRRLNEQAEIVVLSARDISPMQTVVCHIISVMPLPIRKS